MEITSLFQTSHDQVDSFNGKNKLHHSSKQVMTKRINLKEKRNYIIFPNNPEAREFILVEMEISSFFQTTQNIGNSFEKEITSLFQTSHDQVISCKGKRKFHHSCKLPISKRIHLKRKLHHFSKQVMTMWFHFSGKANSIIFPNYP